LAVANPAASGVRGRVPLYLAWLVYGTLLALVLSGWLLYATGQTSVLGYAYRYDFLTMYIGVRAVVTGQGAHLYDLALQRQLTDAAIAPLSRPLLLPHIYPGYVAVLLAPLGLVSYATAFVLWSLLNVGMAAAIIRTLVLTTARRRAERVAIFLVAASFVPILLGLLHGQFGLVALLGLVGAVGALRRGQQGRAGLWLLLCLIKPQVIVLPLLALLIWRAWRTLAVVALGAAACLVVSFAVLGNWIPPYLAILEELTRQGEALSNYPGAMHNWRGLVYNLLGTDSSPQAVLLLGGLTLATVVLAVGVSWQQARRATFAATAPARDRLGWEVRWAVVILLGLLATPHLFLHDMMFSLIAGCMLWRASSRVLAAGVAPPLRGWLHLLRWLLGIGPLALLAAQFGAGPLGLVPAYSTLLIGVALWTWHLVEAHALPLVADDAPPGAARVSLAPPAA
jgi:hypothetical protein